MSYELTKEDYSNLGLLVLITESLEEHYHMLMQLEINEQKDTEEYQRIIEEIKSARQVEEKIYKQIGTNKEKLKNFIEYIQAEKDNNLSKDRMEVAIGKQDDIVTERILRTFDYMISLDYDFKTQLIEREYLIHVVALDMLETILNDEYTCFLSLLEQYIHSTNYKDVKKQFIMTKYRLIFICHEIEKEMLKNKFELLPQVYLQTTCMAQIKKHDEEVVKRFQKKIALDTVENQTYSLLSNFHNSILANKSKRIEAILKICALRAGLLCLTQEDVTFSNQKFQDTIHDDTYQLYYPYNNEIEDMITEAYQQVTKDRTIPVQVSFIKK